MVLTPTTWGIDGLVTFLNIFLSKPEPTIVIIKIRIEGIFLGLIVFVLDRTDLASLKIFLLDLLRLINIDLWTLPGYALVTLLDLSLSLEARGRERTASINENGS